MYNNVASALKTILPDATCADAEDIDDNWNGCLLPYGCSKVEDVEDKIYLQFNTTAVFTLPLQNLMRTQDLGAG